MEAAYHSSDSSLVDGSNVACKKKKGTKISIESLADFWEGA